MQVKFGVVTQDAKAAEKAAKKAKAAAKEAERKAQANAGPTDKKIKAKEEADAKKVHTPALLIASVVCQWADTYFIINTFSKQYHALHLINLLNSQARQLPVLTQPQLRQCFFHLQHLRA